MGPKNSTKSGGLSKALVDESKYSWQKRINYMVKKNDIVEVQIDGMGSDGEGIAHIDGYTLFIKDAVEGDRIEAKVIKTKKTYGYARVEKIIEASSDRVDPICPVARQCGGCQLQHISYEKQLQYKENKVKDCIERIGGIKNAQMEPILGMEELYNYRNKAQFPVGVDKEGNVVIGFYAKRTHSIIPMSTCYINDRTNEKILEVVKEFIVENNIKPYDEKTGKGLIRHIVTRIGYHTKEIMVCLVINADDMKQSLKDDLVSRLKEIPNMKSISLNINKENTNVIMGDKLISLYGNLYITDYLGDTKFRISPLSFYQVNPYQTEKLYDLAMEYANLKGNEVVWDLYCGIGTISLYLSKRAKKVYGVEIVPQAIEDAKINASINNIENAEFYVGAAEDVVPTMYKKSNGKMKADVVVVDPPRKGCDEKLLDTLVKMEPERIVYVSCDPATLARDLKWLDEHRYKTVKYRAVDQFGMTTHVETVCLLSRKDK